jgi:hypothetical protein
VVVLVVLDEPEFVLVLMFVLVYWLQILFDNRIYPETQPTHTKFCVNDWQFGGICEANPNNWRKYITPVLLMSKMYDEFVDVDVDEPATVGVGDVVLVIGMVELVVGVVVELFTTTVCGEEVEDELAVDVEDAEFEVVWVFDDVWTTLLPNAWKLPEDELPDAAVAVLWA